MAEKVEGNKEKDPTRRNTPKGFVERIEGLKDATLRLSERSRHLHEHVEQLERRVQRFTRFATGFLVGALALAALVFGYQMLQMREQIAGLRTQLSSQSVPEEVNEATRAQLTQEVLEAVQRTLPDLVASTRKEGQLTTQPSDISETPMQSGLITGPENKKFRVVVGRTDPKQTPWAQYNESGIYVDIDTSQAGFSTTPYYFTSLGGHTNNWMAQGVTSIYEPTKKGFRVHVGHRRLTTTQAKDWGWYINWVAIGE